jgi:hypothetical protein
MELEIPSHGRTTEGCWVTVGCDDKKGKGLPQIALITQIKNYGYKVY